MVLCCTIKLFDQSYEVDLLQVSPRQVNIFCGRQLLVEQEFFVQTGVAIIGISVFGRVPFFSSAHFFRIKLVILLCFVKEDWYQLRSIKFNDKNTTRNFKFPTPPCLTMKLV